MAGAQTPETRVAPRRTAGWGDAEKYRSRFGCDVRRRGRSGALALTLALLATAGGALAQTAPTGADTALQVTVARALLESGQQLMCEGRLAEAKKKLEASLRNDETAAALLELGACQELLGATASAWGTFHRAEERARMLGDGARVVEAAKRAAALEPNLSKVKVTVAAGEPLPEVTLDDRYVLKEAAWDTALPVDPGPHEVTATSPGKLRFHASFELGAGGEIKVVQVPVLALVPPPPPLRPISSYDAYYQPPPPPGMPLRSRVGLGLAITGGVGAFTAFVIGCLGIGCGGNGSVHLGSGTVIGTLVGGLGVSPALFGVGVYLMTSQSQAQQRGPFTVRAPIPVEVLPVMARDGGGVVLRAAW